MSYAEKMKQELDQNKDLNANQGSDWFKFKEGDNTFRILTEPVMMFEKFKVGICYTDCGYQGTAKMLVWVLDRADGRIKLAKIPYSKGEELLALETDADYGFKGFPMPYDITIKAEGAGTKDVKYSAPLPRPAKELPAEITAELEKRKTCSEIIQTMKDKQKEKHIADGTWQKEQDRKAALKAELAGARTGGPAEPAIEYPEEEIDPNDIPF